MPRLNKELPSTPQPDPFLQQLFVKVVGESALEEAAAEQTPPAVENIEPSAELEPEPDPTPKFSTEISDIDDPEEVYFKQMGQAPLLTADEEVWLAQRIERGDSAQKKLVADGAKAPLSDLRLKRLEQLIADGQDAREHLARSNTRLVISVAKKYLNRGLPLLDLIQEGNVGLMRAVDKFEWQRGNKFSTYAVWWIRQQITRAISQKTRTLRIPHQQVERLSKIYNFKSDFFSEHDRQPTLAEIAGALELTEDEVESSLTKGRHAESLDDSKPGKEGDGRSLLDKIVDTRSLDPERAALLTNRHVQIAEAFKVLSDRQVYVLVLRMGLQDFGVENNRVHMLEEVAEMIGVSRERARQIEKEALRKLRENRKVLRLLEGLNEI